MNEGIELSTAVAHGGYSVIEEQVTNGVAVRMALLYQLCAGRGGPETERELAGGALPAERNGR